MKRWVVALTYAFGILALWNCSSDDEGESPSSVAVDAGAGDATTAPAFEMQDAGIPSVLDASLGDAGSGDAGSGDAGSGDAGSGDAGSGDAGSGDAGSGDAGSGDAGSGDAGSGDAGSGGGDAGDAGSNDAGSNDAGSGDAGDPDGGDASSGDSGSSDAGDGDSSSGDASSPGISAVLVGNLSGTTPGEAFISYNAATDLGTSLATFGTINPIGGPEDNNEIYIDFAVGSHDFGGGYLGRISSSVRRNGTQFFMTTHAYYTGINASLVEPMVENSAYWEFAVQGTYNYSISGQAPQISSNVRTYQFERVGDAVLSEDTVGIGASSFSGQVTTGTYRLTYRHKNFSPNASGPTGNEIGGTNLNISFTLVP
jgi:hypothetical protein